MLILYQEQTFSQHLQQEILDESSETKKSTFSEQDRLPILPVPDLKSTCAKYLKTLEPLSTPEEYAKSVAAVEEFLQPGGIGEKVRILFSLLTIQVTRNASSACCLRNNAFLVRTLVGRCISMR